MNDWKYIDEYESLSNVDFIHCDTRDFHILCVDNEKYRNETMEKIQRSAGYGTLSDCKFNKDEILTVLKDLETRSGGKGQWRHLSIEKRAWLKYVRFVKCEDGYLAYTMDCDEYIPLSHDDLSSPIKGDPNHIE